MRPKSVHFIIPAYKASKTISACLDSIVKQTYPSHLYEISVVENGPADGIDSVVNQYPNCTYHYNPVKGRSEARNYLLKVIEAEFIAFIDVDVVLDKRWLEECVLSMTSPYCAAVTGPVYKEGDQWLDQFRKRVTDFTTNGLSNILENPNTLGGINTAAVLFRTSALKKIRGFDTSFKRSEDYELTHRLIRSGYVLRTTDKATASVYWDRGLFEYFVSRYFQMGLYAPKAHLRHGIPVISFWNSLPVRGFMKLLKIKDPLLLMGWLCINASFVLGHQLGKWKFRRTKRWEPQMFPKRVILSQVDKTTIYEFNPHWEIVIVRNQLRLYNRRMLKFFFPPEDIQSMIIQMLDTSKLQIQNVREKKLIDELFLNQFLLKIKEL